MTSSSLQPNGAIDTPSISCYAPITTKFEQFVVGWQVTILTPTMRRKKPSSPSFVVSPVSTADPACRPGCTESPQMPAWTN